MLQVIVQSPSRMVTARPCIYRSPLSHNLNAPFSLSDLYAVQWEQTPSTTCHSVVSLHLTKPTAFLQNRTGIQSSLVDAPSYQDLSLMTPIYMGRLIGPVWHIQCFHCIHLLYFMLSNIKRLHLHFMYCFCFLILLHYGAFNTFLCLPIIFTPTLY